MRHSLRRDRGRSARAIARLVRRPLDRKMPYDAVRPLDRLRAVLARLHPQSPYERARGRGDDQADEDALELVPVNQSDTEMTNETAAPSRKSPRETATCGS